MVIVAEFPGALGNCVNVTSTESQSMVMMNVCARAAVATPRTRPMVNTSTAAVFAFRLMSPPNVEDGSRDHFYVSGRTDVGHSYHGGWTVAEGKRRFCHTTAKRGQATRASVVLGLEGRGTTAAAQLGCVEDRPLCYSLSWPADFRRSDRGSWGNGSPADSGSASPGSNPGDPARSLRLVAQDTTLSRWRHGFKSRRDHGSDHPERFARPFDTGR
jgi:hypothetical protein